MPALSIRQFADTLNVSHNTVRNTMQAYTKETGEVLGCNEGKGKPTFLSESEQNIISKRLSRSKSGVTALTTYTPSKIEVSKYQSETQTIVYGASDKGEFVATNIEVLSNNLETIQDNTESFDSALLAMYESEGKELGFRLFQSKYGTAFQTFNDLEVQTAKKQGLTKDVA